MGLGFEVRVSELGPRGLDARLAVRVRALLVDIKIFL